MPARHRSRQTALQILFLCDMRQQSVEDAISSFYETLCSEENEQRPERDAFVEHLVKGTSENTAEIDRRIGEKSQHWRLERMPVVDRNILRLAIYEMDERATPPAVVIDEALELARQFAGEESIPFINGVLDAVHREMGG